MLWCMIGYTSVRFITRNSVIFGWKQIISHVCLFGVRKCILREKVTLEASPSGPTLRATLPQSSFETCLYWVYYTASVVALSWRTKWIFTLSSRLQALGVCNSLESVHAILVTRARDERRLAAQVAMALPRGGRLNDDDNVWEIEYKGEDEHMACANANRIVVVGVMVLTALIISGRFFWRCWSRQIK